MRSKTPLVLMEQLIMLATFAFISALCLWLFVESDRLSQEYAMRDVAVREVQAAAEEIKQLGVESYLTEKNARREQAGWRIEYEDGWSIWLQEVDSECALLWQGELRAEKDDGRVLFSVPLARQEGER